MMMILTASRWNVILDYTCYMKSHGLLPHKPSWESLFFGISSCIHARHMDGELRLLSSSKMNSLYSFFICLEDACDISLRLLLQDILITWSSSVYSYCNFEANIWLKHFVWTNPTHMTQCKHLFIGIVISYQNHTWELHALSVVFSPNLTKVVIRILENVAPSKKQGGGWQRLATSIRNWSNPFH
jgi:hypothetical protein